MDCQKYARNPATVSMTTAGNTASPACGYSLNTLQKTGRLGCAVYEKFSEPLRAALVESQTDMVHHGKRPARKKATWEELEKEMGHHVALENYENAARMRDRIAKLKGFAGKKTEFS